MVWFSAAVVIIEVGVVPLPILIPQDLHVLPVLNRELRPIGNSFLYRRNNIVKPVGEEHSVGRAMFIFFMPTRKCIVYQGALQAVFAE